MSTTENKRHETVGDEATGAKDDRLLKRVAARASEVLLGVLLVFLFFLTFTGIIGFCFPQGASLRELMVHPQWVASPTPAAQIDVGLGGSTPIVATLANMRRAVKTRDAHAIAWSKAQTGMELADRHSVQTLANSGASISFGHDNELRMEENSLIIVRGAKKHKAAPDGTVALILLDGALAAETDSDPAKSVPLEITAANGATALLPKRASGSKLRLTVNPDKTATFSLRSGTALVVSGDQTATLEAGYSITADGIRAPRLPVPLPGMPRPTAPADGATVVYRTVPPRLGFEWEPRSECDAYRLTIARDPRLEDVVYDGSLAATAFTHGNLPAGRYFWRVAGKTGWAEGTGSKPRSLIVRRDDEAPPLEVAFPDEQVWSDRLLLQGTTEPGVEVFIGDGRTSADERGTFEYELQLDRGVNVVVVEAIDPAGNVSYSSKLIHASYGSSDVTKRTP